MRKWRRQSRFNVSQRVSPLQKTTFRSLFLGVFLFTQRRTPNAERRTPTHRLVLSSLRNVLVLCFRVPYDTVCCCVCELFCCTMIPLPPSPSPSPSPSPPPQFSFFVFCFCARPLPRLCCRFFLFFVSFLLCFLRPSFAGSFFGCVCTVRQYGSTRTRTSTSTGTYLVRRSSCSYLLQYDLLLLSYVVF